MSRPAPGPVDVPWLELLKQILSDTPNLTGAACVGYAGLFDPQRHDDDETADQATARWADAARLCAQCPVLDACTSAWVTQPDVWRRPRGVVAGRIPDATSPGRAKAS